jgi:putative Mn2+ efflux pump MntP
LGTELIITSVLLGAGLAMDAFSVSVANGLADTGMKTGRVLSIAGTFACFQFAMPLIGWFLVTRAAEKFE